MKVEFDFAHDVPPWLPRVLETALETSLSAFHSAEAKSISSDFVSGRLSLLTELIQEMEAQSHAAVEEQVQARQRR